MDETKTKSFLSTLNSLSYSTKFISFSIVYLIALGYFFYVVISSSVIPFTNTELAGNSYQRPLRKLLEHLPQWRFSIINSNSPNGKVLSIQLQDAIDKDFTDLARINDTLRETFRVREGDVNAMQQKSMTPSTLLNDWMVLKQKSPTADSNGFELSYTLLLDNIRELMLHVGYTSNLIVDPDVDSSYIVDSTLIRLPYLQDAVAQLIFLGDKVIKNKTMTVEEKGLLISKFQMANANIAATKFAIDKAMLNSKSKGDNDTWTALNAPSVAFVQALSDFTKYMEDSIVNAKTVPNSSDELFSVGNNALQNTFSFWDLLVVQFDRLLQQRIDKEKAQQHFVIAVASLCALLGFILGWSVLRSLTKSLNSLIQSTHKISRGDTSAQVAITRNDELGMILIAFNEMAQSLSNIVSQLRLSGMELTSSSGDMMAAATEQEATAVEQEATAKEIAATAIGIHTTAKGLAVTMNSVNKTAEDTSTLAISGKEGLDKMSMIIKQMVEASNNIAAKLAVLNEKASTITSVITTITKVADQTNLLSLNAAIEAEKAGEFGMSFAVIAREIRRLADQTAYATLDIEKMVNEMGAAVSSGVAGVEKFSGELFLGVRQVKDIGELLSKIITRVEQQTANIDKANDSMQHQAQAAEQINEAIEKLSKSAQQTTLAIRQFHKSINSLNGSTKELLESVTIAQTHAKV